MHPDHVSDQRIASTERRPPPVGAAWTWPNAHGRHAGNLSQHLGVLENAGLVEVEKGYEGKRGRTWITLTAAGGEALAAEIGRLKLLIARVERSP
jgi:hypothetical protein